MEPTNKDFIYLLTDWQNRLFAYLVTLLGNVHDAHDALQETNVVLWQKFDEFDPDTDFGAWARKIAYFKALSFLRDKKRDRHLLDDDVLAQFAEDRSNADEEERELALRDCLARLPDGQRDLISKRYSSGGSVRQLAQDSGKKESAMKMTLMRIRQALLDCVESKMRATA